MFVVLLLFVLSEISGLERGFRCTESDEKPLTFEPTKDKIIGRYIGEFCSSWSTNASSLKLDVSVYNSTENCLHRKRFRPPEYHHSVDKWNITGLNQQNCSNVCYSTNFDLVFNGCYYIESQIQDKNNHVKFRSIFKLVNNSVSEKEINETKPFVNMVDHDNGVSIIWIPGIPITDFTVKMAKFRKITEISPLVYVSNNCTLQHLDHWQDQVNCFLTPAEYGKYYAYLDIVAPWSSGKFLTKSSMSYVFNFTAAERAVVERQGSSALWWGAWGAWGAGGAGACGAVLAALLLRRHVRHHHYSQRLKDALRPVRESEPSPASRRDSRPVLLLYAREDERGQRAIHELKEFVRLATGGPVLDLFSPEVLAQCGAAPSSWVQQQVCSEAVRVLLVQTPALPALYGTKLSTEGAAVEPLLGERVMYRCPEFGDQLVSVALRLVAETVACHHHYHKYYVATYSELSTEAVPALVPYRRYELPAAAPLLAAHLSNTTPNTTTLPTLEEAISDYVGHVKEHPDYLMDQLLFLW